MINDIEKAIAELRSDARQDKSFRSSGAAPEFDSMLDALQSLHTEIQLHRPNVEAMSSLFAEAQGHHAKIFKQVTDAINTGTLPNVFGNPATMEKINTVFHGLAADIVRIAEKRTEEFNLLASAMASSVDTRPTPEDDTPMTDLTRQEVDAKLAASEAKVDARLANFDTSIKTGFAELRMEIAKQSGEMRVEMANVRADMHKNTIDLIKWGIVTAIALTSATVGILTFVINNVVPKPSTQPPAQPAPAIAAPAATGAPAQAPISAQPAAK